MTETGLHAVERLIFPFFFVKYHQIGKSFERKETNIEGAQSERKAVSLPFVCIWHYRVKVKFFPVDCELDTL